MLRIVEDTIVSVGRILDELVAFSIILEPFMSLFFDLLCTPGV